MSATATLLLPTAGPYFVHAFKDRLSIMTAGLDLIATVPFNDAQAKADVALLATAPDLLNLAHRYAEECGECAGTRIKPDDQPCDECSDVWKVINQAEGRA